MKGIRMIGLGLLLGLALAAAGAEKVLFSADFLRQVKPTATRTVTEENGVQVLTIQSKTKAGNKVSIPVDPALLSGKSVVFSADVEQENVSAPPKPWNGVKVMLSLVYADGKHNYPQAPNAAGTLPWQTRSARISLPQLKSAAFTLGLEAVSGTVRFRNVQIVEVEMPDYEKRLVTGTANRKDAVYRPGEEMMFSFQILNDGKPESGKLRIIRASDDGRKETFEREVKAEAPCVVRASLNQPGFVMVKAILLDPYGTPAKRRNGRNVQYGLAGGVAAETLKQGIPEPADFDAYWKKAKEQLAAVPLRELERKVLKETAISTVYDVKVACAGKRPVSGYLSIPKGAKPGSLPLRLYFDGYSVRSAQVRESPKAICFFVNAHGIENNREAAYYTALARGELRGYGFRNEENQKPESCYFNNMILRDLRALEYARSLPEWNQKEVHLVGGSQGAFQTMAVAGLSEGITSCDINIPWFCDLGGVKIGRVRGWRPEYAPGLGYFDTVNFARRVKCPVKITAGLSDWVCPPSGVWVLYNNLPGPAELTMLQGLDHAVYPGYDRAKAARTTHRK